MKRHFFDGWVCLEVSAQQAAELLNLCMQYGMTYADWRTAPDTGNARLIVTAHQAPHLVRRCAEEGIVLCEVRRGGLPHLVHKYRYRVGLVIGAVLGLCLYFGATRVLWDIRITGNEQMTATQVREELRAGGLYVGMPLSQLNTDQTEIEIALVSDRLSWVAINLSGTVANVEVRERVATPEDGPLQPANLVARCEGIVEELEIYTGNRMVKSGQAVQTGDLLVSGVYDSQAVGWRVTRASGRVLARTMHDFSVEIPLSYEEKVYVEAPMTQKTIIFFEKEIKLFKNSGILGTSCDKIDREDHLTLGEGVRLPISIRTAQYRPYEYRPAIRDHMQAQELAYRELASKISQALPEATLLRKQITATLTDEAVRLDCRVWCLENIAQTVEFSVDTLS